MVIEGAFIFDLRFLLPIEENCIVAELLYNQLWSICLVELLCPPLIDQLSFFWSHFLAPPDSETPVSQRASPAPAFFQKRFMITKKALKVNIAKLGEIVRTADRYPLILH